jgi:hypothetical protein
MPNARNPKMVIFDPAFSKERKNHILYQALQTLAKGVVKGFPEKKNHGLHSPVSNARALCYQGPNGA